MLYLLLFIILLVILLTIIYTINVFKNFTFFKNMKVNNKKIYISVLSLFIIILAIFLYLDFINVFVVLIHFTLISLVVNFVFSIFKKGTYNTRTIVAILITIIYLGYGFYSAYDVKKTTYNLTTTKNISDMRIAQISDVHLGTTFDGNGFKKYVQEIIKEKPDLIVLTGDFVDDSSNKKDIEVALESFKNVKIKYGIYFIFGNHDKGYSKGIDFTEEYLKEELSKNNIRVLEDQVVTFDNIILVGRQDKSVSNRRPAYGLISELDKEKYIIVLDHQPNDYARLSKTNADLVLSGHTHGGQMLPLGYIGLLMKSNDQVYGLKKIENTNFIVSSGISNWAVKFKTGAIAEYVIINIKKSK